MIADAEKTDSWDAKLYDDRHAFVWKFGASLIELLAPQPGETILDLGCGTGHLTAQIAVAGANVVGIDSSPQMIEQARRAHPQLNFEIADARTLAGVARFDAVFSNAALHWIKEAEHIVRGIARALKPNGRFVAEFGGHGNIAAIQTAMIKALQELGFGAVESPWYYPGIAAYAGLLENAGLEVTFASLFDRPTPLRGPEGMRDWITMFGGAYLNHVPADRRESFFERIEDALRPISCQDGTWVADYRRLRIVAWKRNDS